MSLAAIETIRQVEDAVDRSRAEARAEAQKRVSEAQREGRSLIEQQRAESAARTEEVLQDEEGLRTMRNIGRAMADMVKAYAAAREAGIELHAPERGAMTNFIR